MIPIHPSHALKKNAPKCSCSSLHSLWLFRTLNMYVVLFRTLNVYVVLPKKSSTRQNWIFQFVNSKCIPSILDVVNIWIRPMVSRTCDTNASPVFVGLVHGFFLFLETPNSSQYRLKYFQAPSLFFFDLPLFPPNPALFIFNVDHSAFYEFMNGCLFFTPRPIFCDNDLIKKNVYLIHKYKLFGQNFNKNTAKLKTPEL